MRSKIKICGLMRKQDVKLCCDLGVDICGFVTEYPTEVPWNLTRAQSAELISAVSFPTKSCIVTGGEREKIAALAIGLKPDFVQLHYHESIEDTIYIVKSLSPYNIGVIKTIPEKSEERLKQFGTDDPALCAKMLCKAGVSIILIDGRVADSAAESRKADMMLFDRVKAATECPVMLAGGITPDNIDSLPTKTTPDYIDVMTGVESVTGVKSKQKLKTLCEKAVKNS